MTITVSVPPTHAFSLKCFSDDPANAFTGREDLGQARAIIDRVAAEAAGGTLDKEEGARRAAVAVERETRRWMLARHHLELAARIESVAHSVGTAETMRKEMDKQWRLLLTSATWFATHFRFVSAANDTRIALEQAVASARDLHAYVNRGGAFGIEHVAYLSEMPDGQAARLPSTTEIEEELADLLHTFRERFALSSATSSGQLPPDFLGGERPFADDDEPAHETKVRQPARATTPAGATRVTVGGEPNQPNRVKGAGGKMPADFVADPTSAADTSATVVELPAGDVEPAPKG